MRIRAEQLGQQLSKQLQPCYLVSGDESLLVDEAADQIRQQARQSGFTERQLFHSDSIDWDGFALESESMSLFAERRILEVRIANGKPGDKGSKTLVRAVQAANPDQLILVITGKLDRSQQRSKWVTALENTGGHVQIWPVAPHQMPGWLNQRLRSKGIQADTGAVNLLAERVEGNLLAAQQEVEKLALLTNGPLNSQQMSELVVNSARYDVFTLVDRCLAGNGIEALRTLDGLREEGTEATLVLWALTKEVRILAQVLTEANRGVAVDTAIRNAGVWQKRQPLVQRAAKRHRLDVAQNMLKLCRMCDESIKSSWHGDPWRKIRTLVTNLSSTAAIPAALELHPNS